MTSTQELTPQEKVATVRLPSLTALRAFGALCVFANHGSYIIAFHNPALYEKYNFLVWNVGPISLSFFFVLSGFVLTWGAGPRDTATGFWRGRFFKIFPNHLLVFAVALGLIIASGEHVRVIQAVANLFLVQAWIPNTSFFLYPINGVTWSLSAELFFYACFPVLVLLVNRIRPSRLWLYVAVAIAGVAIIPTIATTFVPETPASPFGGQGIASWPQHWFVFFFPVTRSLEFITGMLLARIIKTGRWIGVGILPAVAVIVAVYAVSLYVPKIYTLAAIFVIPVVLLIGAAATSDLAGRNTLLTTKPMVWLGDISFAFYALHVVVLFYVHAALGGHWAGYLNYQPPNWGTGTAILYLVGALALCVALAGLLFTFVERPAMRRWSRPASARAVSGPAKR
ncbi:acyltransferase [Longispora sp. K20-0274]|uniref:acyltransferase family protein n=1 Tax=Longispora sp. K20-0274 TaxID=3088255 RepID=UPI003999C613